MSTGYDRLRQDGILLDFTILVEDREFRVHRLVMAAESDYFEAMFRNDTLESKTNEVRLQDMDAATIEIVVDFCYTKNIEVTKDNVADLLSAASMMQMRGLKDACGKFLAHDQALDSENCLQILSQGVREMLDDLIEKSLSYCCTNFKSIVETEDFLMIDHELLGLIIKQDRLNVKDETEVLAAVTKWVESDVAERKSHLDDLGPYIRFALFEPLKLVEASASDLIVQSTVCSNLIELAKDLQLLRQHPEQRATREDKLNTNWRSHKSTYLHAFGFLKNGDAGCTKSPTHWRYSFSGPQSETWTEGLDVPLGYSSESTILWLKGSDSVYIYGSDRGDYFLRFDLREGKSHLDVASRSDCRINCRALQIDDTRIAVLGGMLRNGSGNSRADYCTYTDAWEDRQPAPGGMVDFAVAFLNGVIYLAGGIGQVAIDRSDMIQGLRRDVYSTQGNRDVCWQKHSTMNRPRANFGLCVCDGIMYAVGGHEGLGTAEYYDSESRGWKYTGHMNQFDHRHTRAICHDNVIYAISSHKLMEYYDPRTRVWTIIPNTPILESPEIFLAAC